MKLYCIITDVTFDGLLVSIQLGGPETAPLSVYQEEREDCAINAHTDGKYFEAT